MRIIFNILVMVSLTGALSVSEMDNTNRIVLVNVNNCFIHSKVATNESPCTIIEPVKEELEREQRCFPMMATLFIPPPRYSQLRPKVLLLRSRIRDPPEFEYALMDIPNPFQGNESSVAKTRVRDEDFNMLVHYVQSNELIGFLYDHTSSHFYVLMKTVGDRLVCDVYLIVLYGDRLEKSRSQFLYKIDIQPTFADTKWSSNPYRQMFYYQKEVIFKGQFLTNVYAVPFPDLIYTLKNGASAVTIARFASTNLSIQVTGNLIYMNRLKDPPLFTTLNRTTEIEVCDNAVSRNENSVLMVKEYEYCKLKDGLLTNQTKCFLDQQISQDYSFKFSIKWYYILFLTVVLFLSALVMVLLCIRCRITNSGSIRNHNKFSSFMLSRDSDSFDNTL